MTIHGARQSACGLAILLAIGLPGMARADTTNCTAITSLPKTITTPGQYCMASGLSWAGATGAAISIKSDNVVLDCNDNLVNYTGTTAAVSGISGTTRSGVEVRHCRLNNFYRGIYFATGSRRIFIHDNYVIGSRFYGIQTQGGDNNIRGNQVADTVGTAGISADVDAGSSALIRDNWVNNVTGPAAALYGIVVGGSGRATLISNGVKGVGLPTTTTSHAIRINTVSTVTPSPVAILNGVMFIGQGATSYAVSKATATAKSVCDGYTLSGYAAGAVPGCL